MKSLDFAAMESIQGGFRRNPFDHTPYYQLIILPRTWLPSRDWLGVSLGVAYNI